MSYASIYRDDLFQDRSIIVTGGGSGIGRCTAHELASLGAHVTIVGRSLETLRKVRAEIIEDGGQCDAEVADVRDEDSVKNVITKVLESKGQIHGLFNNAGGQFVAPLSQTSKNGFVSVLTSGLVSGFLMSREVYNQCMAKHGGSIVNMAASISNGLPNSAPMAAARAGTINLTKSMAIEWAPAGVRVNAISPGIIESSGLDSYDSGSEAEKEIQKTFRRVRKCLPVRRLGLEAEVSSAVSFLLSDAAAYITGANLKVDGAAGLGVRWYKPEEVENSPVYSGFHRAVKPKVMRDEEAI